MKTKILFLSLLLGLSAYSYAFKIKVSITVLQPGSSIYVNNEYKAKDNYSFELKESAPFILRIEKPGYKTETRTYKYNAKYNSGFFAYTRDDLNVTIDLKEETGNNSNGSLEETPTASSSGDKSQDLTKLQTLKNEQLISDEEHLKLKDDLLSKTDNQTGKMVSELMKLRKILNAGGITKPDFAIIKAKVVSNQYDYTKGKNAPDRFADLDTKSESGSYSKEEIEKLRKAIINSYR